VSVLERTEEFIELRCPIGPKALLAKVVQQGGRAHVNSDNLLELACRDCAKTARLRDPGVRRVLHRFNVLGELVESVVQHDE
jgi:hypothetical protein